MTKFQNGPGEFNIRHAVEADTPLILHFIRKLAEYEEKADQVRATEADLREMLFAEALIPLIGVWGPR